MSRTVVIPDQLHERLSRVAHSEGLDSVEELLMKMSDSPSDQDRHQAVEEIRSFRQRLQTRYGEKPDSTDLVREDRSR